MDEKEIKKIADSLKEELKKEGLQTIAVSQIKSYSNPQSYYSSKRVLSSQSSENCPPVCPCEPVCPCWPVLCSTLGEIPRPPSGGGGECTLICPNITPVPEFKEFQENVREITKEFNQKYKQILEDFRLSQETMINLRDLEKISKLPDESFKSVKDLLEKLRKSNQD